MAIFPGSAIPSAVSDDYEIDNSVRLDNAGADNDANYLVRLEDAWTVDGNQKTWTISWWMKWDNEDSNSERWIYHVRGDRATSDVMGIDAIFLNNAQLQYYCYTSAWSTLQCSIKLNRVFRDPSAWYHCMVVMDSTLATAADRTKFYVNGVRETSFATDTQISQNQATNTNMNADTYIGASTSVTSTQSFGGYIAEFYRIDGQALGPESFGELDSTTNQWKPLDSDDVKDAVNFGTNGFYQKYNSTELNASFEDSSESFKSLYFDTTDDKIVMSTALQGGTDNAFSIAFWMNFNEFTGQCYSQYPDGSSTGRFTISPSGSDGSGKLTSSISGGATSHATSANLDLGTWYHFVLTRDAGTWKWYVNGSLDTTTTGGNEDQLYNGYPWINARYLNPGYCSFRLAQFATWNVELSSSDVTGIYNSGDKTTNWKTSYSSGMKSYYTMNNVFAGDTASTIYDRSGNSNDGTTHGTMVAPTTGHDVEAEGDVTNQRPQPLATKAVNGHAHLVGPKQGASVISFDGSGDYLSVADSTDWPNGTGSWTLEWWMNLNDSDNATTIIGQRVDDNNLWKVEKRAHNDTAGEVQLRWISGGSNVFLQDSSSLGWSSNTWYHLAVVKDGNDYEVFRDGVSILSFTNSTSLDNYAAPLIIGQQSSGGYLDGYMDCIRVSNSARYTADFTAPTSVFVNDGNTKLLIQSGTDGSQTFDDLSTPDHTITANGDVRWFAPKIGAGAMAFDGTNDYIKYADSNLFTFGGEFTIEYFVQTGTKTKDILGATYTSTASGDWYVHIDSNGHIELYDNSGIISQGTSDVADNAWHHVAHVRDSSNTLSLYVDGTREDSDSSTYSFNGDSNDLIIGSSYSTDISARSLNGYLDGVRFSKEAKYSGSSLTVPTAAFTDSINDVLILNADINQGTWFEDTSTGLAISTDSRMKFDGTTDWLQSPDSFDWQLGDSGTGDFTWEMWMYPTDTSSRQRWWTQYGDTNNRWSFELNSGVMTLYAKSSGSVVASIYEASASIVQDKWQHVAFVRDGSDARFYVDGVSKTLTTATALGTMPDVSGVLYIGRFDSGSSEMFSGYMDEIRYSNSCRYPDGTTFTPQTRGNPFTADANTKLLIHSDYTGGLGADSSGNYNNFTATNLVATDQMPDTPTRNWCTLNPLDKRGTLTLSEGNLKGVTNLTDPKVRATIAIPQTGKWYWEFLAQYSTSIMIGADDQTNDGSEWYINNATVLYNSGNGYKYNFSAASSYGDSWTTGDIIGVALNRTDNEITFYKNNSAQPTLTMGGTAAQRARLMPFLGTGTGGTDGGGTFNFGQDSSFAGAKTAQGNKDSNDQDEVDFYYQPPSGYLALLAENLSDPEIKLPGEHFNTILRNGFGSSGGAVTGVGFEPDFLWQKARSGDGNHWLTNSVSGDTKYLWSNSTNAEATNANFVASIDSDGFTMGSDDWGTGTTTVAWNWKAGTSFDPKDDGTIAAASGSKNTTAGFSIVKYTGESGSPTVGHGLGVTPDMIIIKQLTSGYTYDWNVVSPDVIGTTDRLVLNSNAAETSGSGLVSPYINSTIFKLDNGTSRTNDGSSDYIAYCFASIEGYSKVGSWVATGSDPGPFFYCGFKPAFVMVKNISRTNSNWWIMDNKRSTYNMDAKVLFPNSTQVEASGRSECDFLSNGVRFRGVVNPESNYSTDTYLIYAVAENPFKYSNAR